MHDPYWKEASAVMCSDVRYLRLSRDVRAQLIQDIRGLLRVCAFLPPPTNKELADLGCKQLLLDWEDEPLKG